MESKHQAIPNALLRRQRLLRGWSLKHVVEQLCRLCEEDGDIPGITADMVSKWERGERKPSRFYQTKLCLLYGTSADQLGFMVTQDILEPTPAISNQTMYSSQTCIPDPFDSAKTLDVLLYGEQEDASDILAAHLLSLSGRQLALLTTIGWTQQDIINALHIILQGETAMARMNRRQVIQLGAGLFLLSGISFPSREQPSTEERIQLTKALGESITASWALFHTSSNAQVLAVAQAQLSLLQQANTTIYPSVLPIFYAAVYRLIGAALHFQGRYEEARRNHEKAYLAALEGGNAWDMAQSRGWQAYGWKALGCHSDALQVADSALRLISQLNDTESIRLRARLLAFSAENAAFMGDVNAVQSRLHASEELLEYLPPMRHEEFDRGSWLQQAGACALDLRQYNIAVNRLQQALDELPGQWSLRYVSTAVPLASAFTRMGELDEALTIVQKTVPIVKSLQATALTQEFVAYLQKDLLTNFQNERRCQTVVADVQQQLAIA